MKATFINENLNYLDFFGLGFNPFPVAPDDENFYFSEHIEQVVSEIIHGIVTRKGFMVLTGDIGLGKTTICRWIMNLLEEKNVHTSLVFHTTFQDVELLAEINRDFGIKPDGSGFSDQMWALNQFLLERNREGRNCAIIIDDAQNLSHQTLELVRMISNLEAYHEKLVQILLIGQPELMEKLNSNKLRQLKSRIIISKEVHPLRLSEVASYIEFKLNNAGNKGLITIDPKALKLLYQLTGGNFRQVNTLMDRCLYAAFLDNTKEIGAHTIKIAHTDLNPSKKSSKFKLLTGALMSALFVLLVLSGMYILWLQPTNSAEQAVRPKGGHQTSTQVEPVRPIASSVTTTQTVSGQTIHRDKVAVQGLEDTVPVAVTDFLSVYGLEHYALPFNQGLQSYRLSDLAVTIFNATGLTLIQMRRLPEHIRTQYGVLSYPTANGGATIYYLFWKPTISFPKFYYRMMGQNVLHLQKMLVEADLYHAGLDGIVGKHLMQAVIRFQEQSDLEITGYPDELTVFLLAHNRKRNSQ